MTDEQAKNTRAESLIPSEGKGLYTQDITPPKTTRLNLDLNEGTRSRLEALRTFLSASSLTDVVRRAIAIFQAIIENEKAGGQTILRDNKGKETKVVIF